MDATLKLGEWTEQQKSQRAKYALCGVKPCENLLTFEGLPADWKARVEHQQSENDKLHGMLEIMRNEVLDSRIRVNTARVEAYRSAARIAQYHCLGQGDNKDYPSVVGLEIAEILEREAAKGGNQ